MVQDMDNINIDKIEKDGRAFKKMKWILVILLILAIIGVVYLLPEILIWGIALISLTAAPR